MSEKHLNFQLPSPHCQGDSSGDMRRWLDTNIKLRTLCFGDISGTFHVPDSVQHAKKILSEPRWPVEDELFPEEGVMLLASQAVRRFASTASLDIDGLRQVAAARKRACTLNTETFDFVSEFLQPLVGSAINQIFGFDLSSEEVEVLISTPDASNEIITRLNDGYQTSFHGLSYSLSDNERNLFGREAMLLAVMVSYVPLLNLLAFGIRRLFFSQNENLSISKLFVKVCTEEGPTYPGLFRSLHSGEWLIPSTWPGTNVNFTFGFGPDRCPGESLVFQIFEVALSVAASIYPKPVVWRVIFRAGPPFGLDRVIVLIPTP